jgi:hypothetical protein
MPWITTTEVEAALGSPVAPGDDAYLSMATDAANAFAFRRRKAAGYTDDPDTATADVVMGTTLYAVALFRERGTTDSYASFEDLAGAYTPPGSMSQVNKLLGIGKPQLDRVPPTP